jgi:(1->4)-alpha-D-glucan 1-alpha-D-glucosylmutase
MERDDMRCVPRSTYRLQLHPGFTFDNAIEVAGYLKELGISHVYSSPYLQAASGSMHGYNVVDHETVNAELGGEEGRRRFCLRLKELGLNHVLDIVPNHMATGWENRYWWDVLENGPSSRYAAWFDIDWHPSEVKLQNKVLIPVLGDQYGRVLSANQLLIEQESGLFRVRYMDHLLPIAPRSLAIPLAKAARIGNNATLSFIADSLARLPVPGSAEHDLILSRHRDKTVIYELLLRLCTEQPEIANAIEKAVDDLNRDHDALDEVLNLQHYRLAYWRTADQELGYRRFFDINTLIGLRVEREDVFDSTHRRVLEWLKEGVLDGVRIDHPDGLRDPQQYFDRLRRHAPDAWIIAEKILQPGESLRTDWPIEGTTGYDFLNMCNGLLVQASGLQELGDIYRSFIGEPVEFESLARNAKLNVERDALGSDVNRLTSIFVEVCENNRDRRDYTRAEIRRAIREIASCFRIYRTYVAPLRDKIADQDRLEIEKAVAEAKANRPDLDAALMDFIGDVLALRSCGILESEFLMRFQQFTSPVMAKGLEDTAFYCYNRMIGLNEVGGSPDRKGVTLQEFHEYCAKLQAEHPYTMNTLATHDTKRGDDVRARLAVLTELPALWRATVNRWAQSNTNYKTGNFPDRNTEYFLYQTIVGAWPISIDRLTAYMEKAVREAKQQTSWTQQNQEFEDALKSFIDLILRDEEFLAEVESFVGQLLTPGRLNGLAQTLIKCTAPGIPDTYQGGEAWDLRLVDPDNRAPVNYAERQSMLSQITAGIEVEEIMRRVESGMPKLWLVHRALQLRRERPEGFGAHAAYLPMEAAGPRADHVVAYRRGDNVIACVSRWNALLAGDWGATSIQLPGAQWKNELTGDVWEGGEVKMEALLRRFPVALLTRQAE